MDFKVFILGSGAAIPTLKRGTTAHLISCFQRNILIDCGEGTQIQFRRFRLKFQKIDIICITHLHGDHVFGLAGLLSSMQLMGRTNALRIIGPKGLNKLIEAQLDLVGHGDFFPLEFHILPENFVGTVFEDKCIKIAAFPLNHRITTFGYRILEKQNKRRLDKEAFDATGVSVSYIGKLIQGEDIIDNDGRLVRSAEVTIPGKPAKSYAFCSDTAYTTSILPHIQDVDLLYHEATFTNEFADRAAQTGHSTAAQAASIALKANAKRLVLGHFSARYDDELQHLEEAKAIFSQVFAATDGAVFNL
ncbi:MAG: ribonuclease Z [Crocinitomicaceae bacterium]|nr:ribonuclease Z [Crocinitomicaceae bacterium]